MKHPFHTLFYIGFFTMVFIGGFLSLVLMNLKDILPSSFERNQEVISKDVIVPTPIKTLTSPTVPIKPIEKVIPKETQKSDKNTVVATPNAPIQDTLPPKDSTVLPPTP